MQSGSNRQGSSAQQQQQGGSPSGPPRGTFSGGFRPSFLPVDTNIHPDTTPPPTSESPTSLNGSGSNFSYPQPSRFAQQVPPVAPPDTGIDWDEYAGVLHQIIFNTNLFPRGDAIAGSWVWTKTRMGRYRGRNCVCTPLSKICSKFGSIAA